MEAALLKSALRTCLKSLQMCFSRLFLILRSLVFGLVIKLCPSKKQSNYQKNPSKITLCGDSKQVLRNILATHSDGPLMVHADLFAARHFVKPSSDREKWLKDHIEVLESLTDPKNLWIPTFNYQFPKTHLFDVRHSKSEIGPLTEYMRTEWAKFRSLDPIFSFASLTPISPLEKVKDTFTAFSEQTPFSALIKQNGGILFYGAPLSSMTMIHYIERLSGGPLYRYDKKFYGSIIDEKGITHQITYMYHVRPYGRYLDYHWDKIFQELTDSQILKTLLDNGRTVPIYLNAKKLSDYCLEHLQKDPYYFLDRKSREWVEPMIDTLGRRFQINDFEEVES